MEQKKLLMITGDHAEDYEVMIPYQILTMLGHQVHVVSPGKKAKEKIKTAVHEIENGLKYSEKEGHDFELNYDFKKVNPADYDGLILPGGRAPEYLRTNPEVIKIVEYFDDNNKPIAAMCHGPQILAAADVLNGKSLTAYQGLKPEIEMAGGIWQDVTPDEAYIDGNLVTAQFWTAIPKWMREYLDLLSRYETIIIA